MKVTVKKRVDGKRDVFIEKTRRSEKPSRLLKNMTEQDLVSKLPAEIDAVANLPSAT